MDISVIIPTYKPENYLLECLNAIRNQTFPVNRFEVIIILNGPVFPYYDQVWHYIKKNGLQNILLIHTEQKGVSNARNIGLEKTRSNYVIFIDDDDIISPNYLENLFELAGKSRIVVSNVKTFTNSTDYPGEDYISECYNNLRRDKSFSFFKYRGFLSTVWCKIIPVEIIGQKRFNCHFEIGEDSLFIFSISNQIREIVTTGEDVIYYRRIRENSASRGALKISYIFGKACKTALAYSQIFFRTPAQYNLLFYLSRLAAILFEFFYALKAHRKQVIIGNK